MSKRLNTLIAGELEKDFTGLDQCVIVGLTRVPAVSAVGIRADLRAKDVRLRVVKNSLVLVAFKEAGLSDVNEYIDGPVAVMTGGSDVVVLAKAAAELAKQEEGITLRGGYGEGRALSPEDLVVLSRIPGRKELLGSLAGAMSSILGNFAGALGAVQRKFVWALNALKEQREV